MTLNQFKIDLKIALLLLTITIAFNNLNANNLDSLSLSKSIDLIDWKRDSALNELDELLLKAYDSLSFEENIYFHERALDKAREVNKSSFVIMFAQILAGLFQSKTFFDESIHYNSLALSVAKQKNDENLIMICLNNLGVNYIDKEDYFAAIDYFTQAKVYAEKTENTKWESIIDSNIAICYFNLGLFEEAIILTNSSVNLIKGENHKITDNSLTLFFSFRSLLNCHIELNQKDSVSFYVNQLEQYLPILENDTMYYEQRALFEHELGEGLFSLVNYYIENNQLLIAKKRLDKLQALSFAYNSSVYFASLYFAIQSEENEKAEILLNTPPINAIENQEDRYNKYAFMFYYKTKKYEKAIEHLKKQKEVELNTLKLNLSNITKYTETKLDNAKKEQRIIAFEKEQIIQNNKNWFYLIVSMFTALVISILLYLYGVINSRFAQIIRQKNNLL